MREKDPGESRAGAIGRSAARGGATEFGAGIGGHLGVELAKRIAPNNPTLGALAALAGIGAGGYGGYTAADKLVSLPEE